MVDAIRVMAIAADKHAQLVADALSSREETLKSGNGFAAADVSAYLTARAQGKTSSQPTAIPWRAWP